MRVRSLYNRIYKLILSMVLTALPLKAFALGEMIVGAEAHIYHVYCNDFPNQMATAPGYGLVVAAIKTDGYVTQALIFSAKLSVIEDLCRHPFDLQYVKRQVNVDNFMPAVGGEILSIK
jgi:hypothetical protein